MDAIRSKELDRRQNEAVPRTIETLTAPGTDEHVSPNQSDEEQQQPQKWERVKNPILPKVNTQRSNDSLQDEKQHYRRNQNQPSVQSILAPGLDVASGIIHVIHQSK